MSFIAMIVLLGAATSLLFQSATAQAVVFPYNCNSTVPICQTDCVTAVNNICSGSVGQLTTELNTTVNGCTAKYIPYNSVADTKATCLANFQKILAASDAAASTCDGKTPTRIGGVLAMDANNNFVPSTSYAIFPASNNPNCVVNPSQISAPVAAKDNLLGTIYNCASDTGTSVAAPATINTRGWQCPVSITSAALCSSACVLGVFFTISSAGFAAPATFASCLLCASGATYAVVEGCLKNDPRRSIGRPVYERATTPGYCSGTGLDSTALAILPTCLQPAFQVTCEVPALGTA